MQRVKPVNCARAIIVCCALLSATALSQAQAPARPAKTLKVQTPDGLSIAVQEWGNSNGPEILLIHGFSQSHLSWSRQLGGELAKSFRLITYDMRGHGGSDKPLDAVFYRDHKRWAAELKAVMDATAVKKPVLVGWSYGGRIIAEYLMEYGDKILPASTSSPRSSKSMARPSGRQPRRCGRWRRRISRKISRTRSRF